MGTGASEAWPQGRAADYERADSLNKRFGSLGSRLSLQVSWDHSGRNFWYETRSSCGGREYRKVHAATGKKSALFDGVLLARAMKLDSDAASQNSKLELQGIVLRDRALWLWPRGSDLVYVRKNGKPKFESRSLSAALGFHLKDQPSLRRSLSGPRSSVYFLNRSGKELSRFWVNTKGKEIPYGMIKPGSQSSTSTYAGHLWLLRNPAGEEVGRYRAKKSAGIVFLDRSRRAKKPKANTNKSRNKNRKPKGTSPNGRFQHRFENHGLLIEDLKSGKIWRPIPEGDKKRPFRGQVFWSPNSKFLIGYTEAAGEERRIHFVESSPKESPQPKLHELRYEKPGDRRNERSPWLFDLERKRVRKIDDSLFRNAYDKGYMSWAPDSSSFRFRFNARGHQTLSMLAVDAKTAEVRVLVEEKSETFVDYAGKFFLRWIKGSDDFIWMTERSGWNHLVLVDGRKGGIKHEITSGDWVVRKVERVDLAKRKIWFWIGGYQPQQDPYYLHLARTDFDGKNFTVLTEGDGSHQVEFSKDNKTFLDTWSRVDLAPITVLRRSRDGKLLAEIHRGSLSAPKKKGWPQPTRFKSKGRDGKTNIYGLIFKPSNFDPKRRYPVIEDIYAGPHSAFVPKVFQAVHGPQAMAELGFVVVKIDGMGTSHRSKAFHDVCWQNLADSGFPDRKLWIRAAAKTRPYMDLSRVGIYGGSAGGQSAFRALIDHHDFYHVAVADCGCHDNRIDKIWWNELWMGWPIGPAYEKSSNVDQAHRMQGKLLLIVGELDRNVDPASTMQVVDALVKADKDFDLLVIPGAGHGAAGTPYGKRRQRDFFVRHLLGVEPRLP